MRRDAPQAGPNTWSGSRFEITRDTTKEGDGVRAVRKLATAGGEQDWFKNLYELFAEARDKRDVWIRPRSRRGVTLLSAGESREMIADSSLFGVIGISHVVRELRSYVDAGASQGLYAKVVGVDITEGATKVSLALESDRLVDERERMAAAVGRFMCVDSLVKSGRPHLAVAGLHVPDGRAALKLASQIEEVAPSAVLLQPLSISDNRSEQ